MKRRLLALFGIFALCMSLLTVDAAAAEGETVPEEAVPAQRVIVGCVELDDSQGTAYALTDSAGTVTTEGAGADSWNLRLEDGVLTAPVTLLGHWSLDYPPLRNDEGDLAGAMLVIP